MFCRAIILKPQQLAAQITFVFACITCVICNCMLIAIMIFEIYVQLLRSIATPACTCMVIGDTQMINMEIYVLVVLKQHLRDGLSL